MRENMAAVAWLLMVRKFGLEAITPVPMNTGIVHGPTK